MQLTFYGHACFGLEGGGNSIIFDPFLTNNPQALVSEKEIKVDHILVSHFHGDHFGDTESIAERNDALIISTNEISVYCQEKGLRAHNMHVGGGYGFDFGRVKLTQAFHGAGIAGGLACGFLLDFHGKNIYFAGDTGLFGDMELIGKSKPLDVALLPIGDNFTMGPEDALIAAKLLKAKTVIPYHYNTWPLVEADPKQYAQAVEKETDSRVVILNPGEHHTL